jgi:hypothetical protein
MIRWDSIGLDGVKENVGTKDDIITASGATGHFWPELPPGVYDIFVAARGFFPHCEKITVKRNQVRSYEVVLKVSRMMTVKVD